MRLRLISESVSFKETDRNFFFVESVGLVFSTFLMGTGDILLGVALRWTSIPSRGKYQYSDTQCFMLQKPG